MRAAVQEEAARRGRDGRWARLKAYFRDSWLELQKVIWPTQEAVVKMTGLVLAVVLVVSMFIFAWDRILWTITRPLFQVQ